MFGYKSLKDLPELPKLKEEMDEQMRIEEENISTNTDENSIE